MRSGRPDLEAPAARPGRVSSRRPCCRTGPVCVGSPFDEEREVVRGRGRSSPSRTARAVASAREAVPVVRSRCSMAVHRPRGEELGLRHGLSGVAGGRRVRTSSSAWSRCRWRVTRYQAPSTGHSSRHRWPPVPVKVRVCSSAPGPNATGQVDRRVGGHEDRPGRRRPGNDRRHPAVPRRPLSADLGAALASCRSALPRGDVARGRGGAGPRPGARWDSVRGDEFRPGRESAPGTVVTTVRPDITEEP